MASRRISSEMMAKAKEDAAALARLRLNPPADGSVHPQAQQIVDDAVQDPDPLRIHALVLALVLFGWQNADFLTRNAVGHELDADELERLIELFQSDTMA